MSQPLPPSADLVAEMDITRTTFQTAADVRVQRDITIPRELTIRQALKVEGVNWRPREPDDAVLMVLKDGEICQLNLAAALLWERFQDGASGEEAAGILARVFGLPPEQAQQDVASFIRSFLTSGLLTIHPEEAE